MIGFNVHKFIQAVHPDRKQIFVTRIKPLSFDTVNFGNFEPQFREELQKFMKPGYSTTYAQNLMVWGRQVEYEKVKADIEHARNIARQNGEKLKVQHLNELENFIKK